LVREAECRLSSRSNQDVLAWRENRRHSAPDLPVYLAKDGPTALAPWLGCFSTKEAEKGRIRETNVRCSPWGAAEAGPALLVVHGACEDREPITLRAARNDP
jgi:hypothetical protein